MLDPLLSLYMHFIIPKFLLKDQKILNLRRIINDERGPSDHCASLKHLLKQTEAKRQFLFVNLSMHQTSAVVTPKIIILCWIVIRCFTVLMVFLMHTTYLVAYKTIFSSLSIVILMAIFQQDLVTQLSIYLHSIL